MAVLVIFANRQELLKSNLMEELLTQATDTLAQPTDTTTDNQGTPKKPATRRQAKG